MGGCGGRGNKNLYIQTSQPIRLLYFKIPEVIIFGWAAELIEYHGRASDLPSAQEYISRQLHRRRLDRMGVVSEPMSCNLRWQTQYYDSHLDWLNHNVRRNCFLGGWMEQSGLIGSNSYLKWRCKQPNGFIWVSELVFVSNSFNSSLDDNGYEQ